MLRGLRRLLRPAHGHPTGANGATRGRIAGAPSPLSLSDARAETDLTVSTPSHPSREICYKKVTLRKWWGLCLQGHPGKDFSGSLSCKLVLEPREPRDKMTNSTYVESPLDLMSGHLMLSYSSRPKEHNVLVILMPPPPFLRGERL